MLLSPKTAKIILDIVKEAPFSETNFKEDWNKMSGEFKTKVVPVMREELGIEEH